MIAAVVGVSIIGLGICFQVAQLIVSFRGRAARRDVTGDPWGGRTLEWATASPPPLYNFATTPRVRGIDALADMKASGAVPLLPAARYSAIHMPKNTASGLAIGTFGLVLGFALVWHIGWLAIVGFGGMLVCFIRRSFDDDTDRLVPAEHVARIEGAHFQRLAGEA
jgi:cytochrome o ubiquinol oxidase subunit 1